MIDRWGQGDCIFSSIGEAKGSRLDCSLEPGRVVKSTGAQEIRATSTSESGIDGGNSIRCVEGGDMLWQVRKWSTKVSGFE